MDIRNPLIHHRIGHPDWFVEKESQYERCSKPRLVDDYRGLYYIILTDTMGHVTFQRRILICSHSQPQQRL